MKKYQWWTTMTEVFFRGRQTTPTTQLTISHKAIDCHGLINLLFVMIWPCFSWNALVLPAHKKSKKENSDMWLLGWTLLSDRNNVTVTFCTTKKLSINGWIYSTLTQLLHTRFTVYRPLDHLYISLKVLKHIMSPLYGEFTFNHLILYWYSISIFID